MRRKKKGKKKSLNPFSIDYAVLNDICNSKKMYDSYWQAKYDADYLKKKYGQNLCPYQCNICGNYHLTHNPERYI